jgi:hypothetical protein
MSYVPASVNNTDTGVGMVNNPFPAGAGNTSGDDMRVPAGVPDYCDNRLSERHAADLRACGVTAKTIQVAAVYAETNCANLAGILGWRVPDIESVGHGRFNDRIVRKLRLARFFDLRYAAL